MNLRKYVEQKIFVTGLSASGKTTFAKEYSIQFDHPFISFDENWTYHKSNEDEYKKIIAKCTDRFIMDAIPFATINGRFAFLDYYDSHQKDIKIVCVCCTDSEEFDKRMSMKKFQIKNAHNDFYVFYFETLQDLYSKLNIDYYDSFSDEFITEKELYKRIKWANKN